VRIVERSPDQRQLNTLFLPQEPRRVMPDEVAEEIVLTHPAQPPSASFLERIFRSTTSGAVGVTTVDGPSAPSDRYWWVQAATVFNNDSLARVTRLFLGSSTLGFSGLASYNPGIDFTGMLAPTYKFLVPPGLNLRATLNALGAGQVLTLDFIYVELLLAENHPGI